MKPNNEPPMRPIMLPFIEAQDLLLRRQLERVQAHRRRQRQLVPGLLEDRPHMSSFLLTPTGNVSPSPPTSPDSLEARRRRLAAVLDEALAICDAIDFEPLDSREHEQEGEEGQ